MGQRPLTAGRGGARRVRADGWAAAKSGHRRAELSDG
jgi:hypothetical protein